MPNQSTDNLPLWKRKLREKELRENKEITPAQFARNLGMSPQHFYLVLKTLHGYNKRLIDIAVALNLTPEELRESLIRESQESFLYNIEVE